MKRSYCRPTPENGASPYLCDDHGNNALHVAVLTRNWKICGRLLNAGIVINYRDRDGATPWHLAATAEIEGSEACMMLLSRSSWIGIMNFEGLTAYQEALIAGRYDVAGCLYNWAVVHRKFPSKILLFFGEVRVVIVLLKRI